MGTGTSLVKRNRNIRLINIDKEEVLEKISDVMKLDHIEVKTELLNTGELIIHLSATGDTEEEAKSLIKPIVKELKEDKKENIIKNESSLGMTEDEKTDLLLILVLLILLIIFLKYFLHLL